MSFHIKKSEFEQASEAWDKILDEEMLWKHLIKNCAE